MEVRVDPKATGISTEAKQTNKTDLPRTPGQGRPGRCLRAPFPASLLRAPGWAWHHRGLLS